MTARHVILGLPTLATGGLSENWLLRECGDLHWSLIGEHFGTSVTKLADSDGTRLLPAFVRVRHTASASFASFAELDEGEMTGQLTRLDDRRFLSDIRFTTGTAHVDVRLLTVFVRRSDRNWLVPGVPQVPGCLPVREPTADQLDFLHDFQTHGGREPGGSGLHTERYELNPVVDVNALGLLYFASYPHINDHGERRYLHSLAPGGEWATAAATVSRDIVYLANCGAEDAVRYRLDDLRLERGHRAVLASTLLRERDGRPLARIETVKVLRGGSVFGSLWGDHVAATGPAALPADTGPETTDLDALLLPLLERALDRPAGTLAADDDLRRYGLDSVALAEVVALAEGEHGLRIDPSAMFQAFTVAAMARVIRGEDRDPEPIAAVTAVPQPQSTAPIAVIGMAGRFPGAAGVTELWDLLGRDEDAIRDIPTDRWDTAAHPGLVGRAALLDDIRRFDHEFFAVSPREAALMDPQQRLMLEVTWATAEDAGQDPSTLAGSRTGVYTGVCHSDYAAVLAEHAGRDEPHLSVAVSPSLVANRVSYALGLRGPSVAVDTLCSSSLVAVANAVAALRAGVCDQAFAGGVNVLCDPGRHAAYQRAGVLSPRGRCHTFDDAADGYVRGEGACALLLKPLDRALADGDRVHAVIREVAVNHGGQAQSFTAPNPDAQADLLVSAYTMAGVDPTTVGYLEAHGTGTRLGDPIEVSAMVTAFRRLYARSPQPMPQLPHCGIGSVKTNIGHLEAAAGIAGMIKVILAMHHRTLPATRNVRRTNRMIDLAGSPLRLQVHRAAWEPPPGGGPRRAGVSSFGMGGTNAHVVLEEAPPTADAPPTGRVTVPVSARTPQALREAVAALLNVVRSPQAPPLASIARTMRTGRAALPCRVAVTAADLGELADGLAAVLDAGPPAGDAPVEGPVPAAPVVSLPTYPFRRDQHWAAPTATPEFLTALWRDAPPPTLAPQGRLLVVTTDPDLAPALFGDDAVAHRPGDPLPAVDGLTGLADLVDWSEPGALVTERIELLREVLGRLPRTGLRCLHVSGARRSVLAGFYRALSGELPMVVSRTVRVDGDRSDLATAVAAERAADDRETEIRYVGSRRQRRVVGFARPTGPDPLTNLGEGAVLITGGTGAIGLRLAAHLADRGARHLVLIGRSPLPVRSRWVSLAAAGSTDPLLRARLTQLLALTDRGVTLSVHTHPLDDVTSLRRLMNRVRGTAGDLTTVIHCAGVMHAPQSFLTRTRDETADVLRPKLAVETLWAALGGRLPRLLVLFSSIAASSPRLAGGHLDYAAANGVLDDFAEAHADEPRCLVRSLRFPLWRGIGMGERQTSAGSDLGIPDLDEAEALRLFDLAVRVPDEPVLLPCLTHRAGVPADEFLRAPRPAAPPQPAPVLGPGETAPVLDPGDAPRPDGIDWLLDVVARTTRTERSLLRPETNLVDLGVDSLLMAELVRDLEVAVRDAVDPSLLQEHPTLAGLARALTTRSTRPPAARPAVLPAPTPVPPGAPVRIAVIGMGCRLPGAADPGQLWQALLAGRDMVGDVPPDRWDVTALYRPGGGPGLSQSRWGGFLDDAALFDPAYFGFDDETARQLDPLVRKTLEVAVECVRDAGYTDEELHGRRVGVFVGSRTGNHRTYLRPLTRESIVGINQNYIAAHVSHFLDLTGPNLVVDSACSSALVSVHLAVQSLLLGESELALAGGVDLLLDEEPYLMLSAGSALSPTGRCRTFDESADGFVPGEGAGLVLLKRLDDAQRDGDRVLAVIESSGVNNDGRTMGHTTPSGPAQRALITEVLARGGIDARTIGYVEAHGTGTMIGDPIELQALTAVYRRHTDDRAYCGIGSVKSSMGHLLSAAGIAGFIKAVQTLRYGLIAPTLHCERPNPRFAFAESPFFPARTTTQLPAGSRVAVSAFGFGGTNAHVVLGPGAPEGTGRAPLAPPTYRRRRFWPRDTATRTGPAHPVATPLRPARLDLTVTPVTAEHAPTPRVEPSPPAGHRVDLPAVSCRLRVTGNHPIVDDHRVHGVRTLPGVTFLDIVYRLLDGCGIEPGGVGLSDVLFVSPLTTGGDVDREVTVALEPDGEVVRVTATSRRVADGVPADDTTTHLRATVRTGLPALTGSAPPAGTTTPRDVGEVYATGRSVGIEHRAFMRCHGTLRVEADTVVAQLALGTAARATVDDFMLHPALLDGSTMQAYALAFAGADADARPLIPLHIGEFRATRPLGDGCTVAVRLAPAGPAADIVRADIDLYDGSGVLSARFSDLVFKRVRSTEAITRLTTPAAAPAPPVTTAASGTDGSLHAEIIAMVRQAAGDPDLHVETDCGFYDLGLESTHLLSLVRSFEQRWGIALYPTLLFEYPTVDAVAEHLAGLVPAAPPGGTTPAPCDDAPDTTVCVTGEWCGAVRPDVPSIGPLVVIGDAPLRPDQIVVRRGPAFRRCGDREYELRPGDRTDLQALLASLPTAPGAVVHVGPPAGDDLPAAVETACREMLAIAQVLLAAPVPVVHVAQPLVAAAVAGMARTIRLEQPRLTVTVVECAGDPDPQAVLAELADHGETWVRHEAGRFVRRYRDVTPGDGQPPRPGGVYLITGGAGGLGRALATSLTSRGATVVLAGRNPARESPAAEFVRADVTVATDVRRLVDGIIARHGRLDGVVHAAGVLRDGLLAGKSPDDLSAVLAPKVRGTVLLHEATRHLDLDFFVAFSSVTGVAGNVGQADYGAANAFVDAYAREHGLTSVAWPLWADGGMRTDPATEAVFRHQGQTPLPTATGLAVLDAIRDRRGTEIIVLHGRPDQARRALGLREPATPSAVTTAAPPTDGFRTSPLPTSGEPDRAAAGGSGSSDRDIAVIGVAGRYPMAADLDRFWANLLDGRDCVTEIPQQRWRLDGFFAPEPAPGRSYSKWGGFLDGIDEFDPAFFRITPREAEGMDPQERLFLQVAWHALEDAGITRTAVAGRAVGVFAGVMFTQYQMLGLGAEDRLPVLPTSFASSVANRVSYFLDARGPSLAVDTMCSSSLTALHLACESLRCGESGLALAGGVNLIVHPYKYLHLSQVGFVSSDGRCRAFGAGGDGYVPGEGVGVVVLKPLADAVADGDRVLAVIKGSAVNHGGRASGFFVPNPSAQADVLRRALRRAGVDPATVSYLEAHGTGTALGDPVEISALSQVFGAGTTRLGSVKSGIGHLESAAGIAAFTKVLLQLRHRTLVPSLHARPANEAIDWEHSPLSVQQQTEPWHSPGGLPRRAGISAFGAGGSNAHVIVEEYPQPTPETGTGPQVVLLSARTPQALRLLAERYTELPAGDRLTELADAAGLSDADPDASFEDLGMDADDLRRLMQAVAARSDGRVPRIDAQSSLAAVARALGGGIPLADVAYTTQVGRDAMVERLAVVATDVEELRAALRAFLTGDESRVHRGRATTPATAPVSTDPDALAAAWVTGAAPDWRALHRERRARKVALPGYPFARVRCWVGTDTDATGAVDATGAADAIRAVDATGAAGTGGEAGADGAARHREPVPCDADVPSWEVCANPEPVPTHGPVLVLYAPGRERLATGLAARHPGAQLVELGGSVTGDPGVIYLLTGSAPAVGTETARVADGEAAGVHALAAYARRWAHLPELHWIVVTVGAAAPPGRQVTDPYVAGVLGFTRVLENEHPGWSVAAVDVDPAHVSAGLLTPARRGTRVAYTGATPHRLTLRPAPTPRGPDLLRRGGRYLIVGGGGGIGLALARKLVTDRGAEVVLVGRRERPDLAAEHGIRYLRADARDVGQLATVLERAGTVHGIMHAAMVQRSRLVRDLTDDDLVESLGAKSGVAAALIDAIGARELDFLLFFSSAQSFLGEPGLGNYAAGSTFLDAYAHALDGRLPYPVRAINWGFWGTVGSVATDRHRAELTAAGFHSITAETGFGTLTEALRRPAPQLVVVPGTAALRERMTASEGTTTVVAATDGLTAAERMVVDDFHAVDGQLTAIARSALLALLHEMHAWRGPDPDATEVARRVGVTARYERLLHTLLTMLADGGVLTVHEGRFRPDPAALTDALAGGHGARLDALAAANPDSAVFVELLRRCLDHYPELLRGELLATDLLFPASGTTAMEQIYRGNPISDLYNDLLTARLLEHVDHRRGRLRPDDRIRILEVGSGTGGTTAGLLHALAAHGEHLEYWYTDLSVAFLAHGRREFGGRYPFVRFKRLDLDTDLVAQGFPAAGFDLVVGANVLHATSDVSRAARHLRAVLRPDGQLLLNELTTVTLAATVTYGLFDGWWAHTDTRLRLPGSPLLSVSGWDAVLSAAGYARVRAVPGEATTSRNFQHVIVAAAAAPVDEPAPAPGQVAAQAPAPDDAPFTAELLALTAAASGIPVEDLDLDTEIGDYGFDSVSYSLLAGRLNDTFGFDVTPALFYETATLRALVTRLGRDHAALLRDRYPQAVPETAQPDRRPEPALRTGADDHIAVIGLAARLPGSPDLDAFWNNIVAGADLVGDVPADRWDWRSLPDGVHARRGGFIGDVDRFDPLFFGISPEEADGMDPQQRLLLEGVWSALEDAGLPPGTLAGRPVGLFVGVGSSDYDEIRRRSGRPVDAYAATATAHSILVNRVSYLLDLRGPSEPVNTGCSSSLVAIHRAAAALRAGECDVAVAGGVNLILSPHNHVLLSRTGMLSPSGRCQAFDARADGFVRGEGLGLVVLTRAGAAGRHLIRGLLLGSAVNHGGRARSLTAPNPAGQAAMIVRAYTEADVDPATVGYLETHGTGTELGDPVEVNGLRMAFDELARRHGRPLPDDPFCALGAVKANIGHLESAAGVAGLVKVLLAMRHGVLPPVAGLAEPNPHLRLDGGPFQLIREATPWHRPPGGRRRAGVSSFGYGGVNAHVVVEEPAAPGVPAASTGPWVFPLSARTAQALHRYALALRAAVDTDVDLADVAYTLQHGRDAMTVRLAVTAADRTTLVAALTAAIDGTAHAALAHPDGVTAADRWTAGADIDWPDTGGTLIPLPTYPFERRRCWTDPRPEAVAGPGEPAVSYAPRWRQIADMGTHLPATGTVWLLGDGDYPAADVHRVTSASLDSLPTPAVVHAVVTGGEPAVLHLFRVIRHLQTRPGGAGDLTLTVVTRAAAAVDGPVVDPVAAAAHGLVKSTRRECERWRVSAIDVGPGDATLVAAATPGDYALRSGRWYRRVLQPLHDAGTRPVFRDGGTYVLVGGAGDVGLDVAEHLVRSHRARVVLVGRTRPAGERAARISALDPTGTLVEFQQADARDADRMRAVFDRLGVVHGVVHATTVARDRSLAALDEDWFVEGLIAKTRTTLAVAEAIGDRRLDFFAIFSSLQSFLGNPGQATYAAACTAQDAIGHALAARLPYPVRVLNWGPWSGSTLTERHRGRLAAAGFHPLPPGTGIEVLAGVLDRPEIQVVVMSGTESALNGIGVETTGQAPVVWAPEPWRETVATELLAMVRAVAGLSVAELGEDDQLNRFGFDSIMYTRLSHQVNVRWGLDATPAAFFGVSTARELVAKILDEYGAELARHHRPPTPAAPTPAAAVSVAPRIAGPAVLTGPAPDPQPTAADGVAIVGMAGMLPGSDDLDEFWAHLVAGDDLVTEIPPDRWDWRRIHGTPEPGEFRTTARWGGFLRRVDLFDAEFFGVSPTEATAMDPQHRLVLEAAWTAIEDAGIRPSDLAGTDTGVFVGSSTYDYFELQHALAVPLDGYQTVGRAHAILSNRVSYLLDLHGPSETIDTACSSSLVAVHHAAEAIRSGECTVALAGGVNVIASPTLFVDMSQADMLSPDGRCRAFDARANGIARAEGAGIVVLKRLSDALADGNVIHGVLLGSAINHGGRSNSLTAPNPAAQAACIVAAHRRAGTDPRTVTYVETHGTGTELGDPVEIEGLKTAFRQLYADRGIDGGGHRVALGAVKSNTGHLEAAAGVTGLIKVLLAMRHRELPGNPHLETLNPHLRLDGSPLHVLRGNEPWRPAVDPDGAEVPLRAGLSSFGLGGVNTHLVLEEFRVHPGAGRPGPYLFVLSARDAERLRGYAEHLVRWVRDATDVDPAALAYTLQTGREVFAERLAVVADDTAALVRRLTGWLAGTSDDGVSVGDGRGTGTALLLDGPEGRQYLRAVMTAGKLDKIARLWVDGVAIDWTDLWPGEPVRRITAPTSAFARQSYWITPGPRFDRVQAAATGLVAADPAQVTDAVPEAVPPDPAPVTAVAPVPAATGTGGDPEAAVRDHVRDLLAAHLGMDPDRLSPDRVLSDVGVDSLGLRRLSRRLGATYGVDVPTRLFNVGQTVRALARTMHETYGPLPAAVAPAPAPGNGIGALLAGLRDGSVKVDDALADLRWGNGR
ncbi:SDR family NAD(P)-dependent oxidoreductase [Micromonospora humida]|uniref:SDR family NAD(P)-dependent oxidoreductase n=1 Tax=Micromonospora humida TaxID=2809018 RepID=A0ABS2IUJ0_9ACTN|nr:SDR family NAD(P)-dependent oxidoreductase [Micromonospora humida]MBM7077194.1 SDR family NAD(P)-dependent oxidoreductase [Micromonospora humida]